jgi:hypothetical protein
MPASRSKRRKNCRKAPRILKSHGLSFKVKNHGYHLMVDTQQGLVHYWPSNGRWQPAGGQVQIGLESFLAYAKGDTRGTAGSAASLAAEPSCCESPRSPRTASPEIAKLLDFLVR